MKTWPDSQVPVGHDEEGRGLTSGTGPRKQEDFPEKSIIYYRRNLCGRGLKKLRFTCWKSQPAGLCAPVRWSEEDWWWLWDMWETREKCLLMGQTFLPRKCCDSRLPRNETSENKMDHGPYVVVGNTIKAFLQMVFRKPPRKLMWSLHCNCNVLGISQWREQRHEGNKNETLKSFNLMWWGGLMTWKMSRKQRRKQDLQFHVF